MIEPFTNRPDDLAAYVELKRNVWPHEEVSVSSQGESDANRSPDELGHRFLYRLDGRVVGSADVYSLPFSAAESRFGMTVLVDPDSRRMGVGTALYDHIVGLADVASASGWESTVYEGEMSGAAWLEHLGFTVSIKHQMSELELTTVDTSPYASVIESVEASGVTLMSLVEFTELDPGYAQKLYDLAIELSKDAPWHEEVSKPPLDQWRHESIESPLVLGAAFTVAVVDGEPVGQSALSKDRRDSSILRTGLTGVRRPYRRMGIARAMKMRAIERAVTKERRGAGVRIVTGNASDNPMLALNLSLGFVPQPAWLVYTKDVESP